jgi:hypothetical protein
MDVDMAINHFASLFPEPHRNLDAGRALAAEVERLRRCHDLANFIVKTPNMAQRCLDAEQNLAVALTALRHYAEMGHPFGYVACEAIAKIEGEGHE